ncbi:MAG: sigma-54-dependent Fis family transcriptional regulator [Nitrospirae bacterium]|nr:sigma-54-dependent Fis family transcriptional regulator [Nitrospirota bacterium]
MLNVLIISNEAGNIRAAHKAGGFALSADRGDSGEATDSAHSSAANSSAAGYDLTFLDLDLPDWRYRLTELRKQAPVIAFSHPDINRAVEAMKLGAGDYVSKPLTPDVMTEIIGRYKKKILNRKYGFDEITGTSAAMQEIFGLITRAAASESNVLVTGESGTGKELVARAIHRWSPRSDGAFVSINCGAIPDTLLESELFGFEKGAFTGANYTKKGLVESAHGGTLFFDEIGDVSPMFQIKVLRMLQEGEIMRVGGMRPIKVDVRIITATNKDLRAACRQNVFREDLFYRLNVINIHLPPLRDRMDDIPHLAIRFIEKHAGKRRDMVVRGISPEAMNTLMNHSYPGNVRELENIIERAISFTNSPEILPADLPGFMREGGVIAAPTSFTPILRHALAEREREVILAALRDSGGNISRAAASLGIYRQQLQRKLRQINCLS